MAAIVNEVGARVIPGTKGGGGGGGGGGGVEPLEPDPPDPEPPDSLPEPETTATPVPVTVTIAGLLTPLWLMVICPEKLPADVGIKLTTTVALSPTFTFALGGIAGESVNIALFDETPLSVSVDVPVFLSRNCAWDVCPTSTFPKSILELGNIAAWLNETGVPHKETIKLFLRSELFQPTPVL